MDAELQELETQQQLNTTVEPQQTVQIEYVDSNKIQRPSVTELEKQKLILEGESIVLYINVEQQDTCSARCKRKMVCMPTQNKLTTTFLKVELPKNGMVSYLLLNHIDQWEQFSSCSRFWILFAAYFPILIQIIVAAIFYVRSLSNMSDNGVSWNYTNILSGMILMMFMSREVSSNYNLASVIGYKEDDKKFPYGYFHARIWMILRYIVLFNLYLSAIGRVVASNDITEKIEVGVGVFFVLELDDWLYELLCEPLVILDDELFHIYIQTYGTLQESHDYWVRSMVCIIILYLLTTAAYIVQFVSTYGSI